MNQSQPLLTIIITSYTTERLKDIYELLDSIKSQTYPYIEAIFIAEHSRELYERVREYGNKIGLNFRILWNNGKSGLSAARNLGIKYASGDIIAFVDDDTLLFPNWAEEMIKSCEDDSIIGVTGPAFPLWEDRSMSWFPEEFYWIISCTAWFDCNRKREVRNAWGMNMAFKREAFDLCGLFHNEFGFHKGSFAEDNEFSLRVKAETDKKILFCPEMKLWHRVHKYRISLDFIRERAYWIGYSRRNLKKFYGKENNADLLELEYALLVQILTKFFPKTVSECFTKSPIIACRKFLIAITALFFVSLGYYSHLLPFNRCFLRRSKHG